MLVDMKNLTKNYMKEKVVLRAKRLCYGCKKRLIDVEFGGEKFGVCTNKECPRFGMLSLVAYEDSKKG